MLEVEFLCPDLNLCLSHNCHFYNWKLLLALVMCPLLGESIVYVSLILHLAYPYQPKPIPKIYRSPQNPISYTQSIPQVQVTAWLEPVGALAAAEALGIPRGAAQSCMAVLSRPGGLFLDVKSAYSSARDVELFSAALQGIGIHVKVGALGFGV